VLLLMSTVRTTNNSTHVIGLFVAGLPALLIGLVALMYAI
jgi:hypothetical protein